MTKPSGGTDAADATAQMTPPASAVAVPAVEDERARKLLIACRAAMQFAMSHTAQTDWTLLIADIDTALSAPAGETRAPEMVFIEQTGAEDCERCCYAMLLGIDLHAVPNFIAEYRRRRTDSRRVWLRTFGLDLLTLKWAGRNIDLPNALVIAGVESPTGHEDGHAVIGKIEDGNYSLIYDPSPLREKSGKEPFDITFLVRALLNQAPGAQARAQEDDARDELIRQAARRRNAMWAANNMADGDLIEALLRAFTVTHQDGSRHAAVASKSVAAPMTPSAGAVAWREGERQSMTMYAAKLSCDPALASVESTRILEAILRVGIPFSVPAQAAPGEIPYGNRFSDEHGQVMRDFLSKQPHGWKLVPDRPTKKWLDQLCSNEESRDFAFSEISKMLAASPAAPQAAPASAADRRDALISGVPFSVIAKCEQDEGCCVMIHDQTRIPCTPASCAYMKRYAAVRSDKEKNK